MKLTNAQRLVALAVAAMISLPAVPLRAQEAPILRLADGRTVEVLGLKHWTLAMLQDSLAKYSPGDSLQSHACAVVLRYKLHFADAASNEVSMGDGSPNHVVVTLREPQDSNRVHYRMMPLDSTNPLPRWARATASLARHPGLFQMAIGTLYLDPTSQAAPRFRSVADSAEAVSVVEFLRARTAEKDRLEGLDALAHASNMNDRVIAALILINFGSRDDTWWALVDAMRESDGPVKGFAARALEALSTRSTRTVNWRPRNEGIHAMLDGTSLFVLPALMEVLLKTGVGPANARAFLRGGGEILLAYLGSAEPMLARASHALLVQLRGQDLGLAVDPWRKWVASL